MLPAQLDYAAPTTITDAVAALSAQPDALLITGSGRAITDLKMRRIAPRLLIDLRKIPGLLGIVDDGSRLRIGALTTLRALTDDKTIQSRYAALAEAAAASGDPQMRNMETVGGNLTYDAGSSDIAVALLALNADLHVVGSRGERTVSAYDAVTGGTLAHDDIIIAVSLPSKATNSAYEKFEHPATLAPVCGVAVSVETGANGTVVAAVLGVVGATQRPTRLKRAEETLSGQPLDDDSISTAASVAADGLETVTDLQFSGDYRAHFVRVLLKRALTRLA